MLAYHVGLGELDFFDVIILSIFGQDIDTLNGETIRPFFFRLIDQATSLRNPRLTFPFNLQADNGIVHAIDRVLIPLPL